MVSACSAQSNEIKKLSYNNHISKAREYNESNKLDEAIKEYKMAIKLNPAANIAHYELGLTYMGKWLLSFQEARKKHLRDAFNNPDKFSQGELSDEELDLLYESYGAKKEFEQLAIYEFKETLKYNSDNWMARFHIASDLLNKGHYDEAISEYEKVIQINPNYVNSYGLMGKAYFEKGLFDLAIEKYKKVLILDPKDEESHYEIALVCLKLNKKQEALKKLETLKKMDSIFYEMLKREIEFKQ